MNRKVTIFKGEMEMIKLIRVNRATDKLLKNITRMYQEEIDNPNTDSERRIELLDRVKTFNDLNDEREKLFRRAIREDAIEILNYAGAIALGTVIGTKINNQFFRK